MWFYYANASPVGRNGGFVDATLVIEGAQRMVNSIDKKSIEKIWIVKYRMLRDTHKEIFKEVLNLTL